MRPCIALLVIVSPFLLPSPALSQVGVDYQDPPGGWAYAFLGDAAAAGSGGGTTTGAFDSLDGTWNRGDGAGSDSWDGSAIGTGRPGGISALLEGSTSFIRIQNTGNPANHGQGDPGSNRRIYLGHSITADGFTQPLLDQGVTLSFRARIATGPPLDPQYPSTAANGENNATPAGTPWPAEGNGWLGHDGGKGLFGIRQASPSGIISFNLTLSSDLRNNQVPFGQTGLTMNSRDGSSASAVVDPWEYEGTVNVLPMEDLTVFHEFWITIAADTSGGGSHRVEIYANGELTPNVFHVTAGNGNDYGSLNYLGLGLGGTPQQGAVDVDFFAYKPGIHLPQPSDTTSPVGFVLHPASEVNLVEGQALALSVAVTGAPPVSVQWYKNGVVIPGATQAAFMVENVTLGDAGTYHAVANNNVPSTATSGSAVVTVIPDTFPPEVDRIVSDPNMTEITIYFSEPLLPGPAVDAWNYFLAPTEGGEQLFISTAEFVDSSTIRLVLQEPREAGVHYSLSFEGIQDLFNNLMDPAEQFAIPPLVVFQEGSMEYSGTLDTDLRFGTPDTGRGADPVVLVDGLDAGGAVHGLLWFQNIFGNEPGQIPLGATILSARLQFYTQNPSVDSVRLHRMLIPWSESDTWNSLGNGINADGTQAMAVFDAAFVHNTANASVQVDVTASLQAWAAGASYYGWALLPVGNDGYSFTSSEGTDEQRPMLVVEFEVVTGGIEITQEPESVINANEGATFTLSVAVTGSSPGFQWYKDSEPVPGAASASLLFQNATAADSGAYHVVVSNEVNTVTSSSAQVTVNADLTAPVVVSAVAHWNLTDITIRFSKPIDPASVNLANITVRSETGTELVLEGFQIVGGTDLVLTTSPRQTDVNYTATLSGITDLAVARNEIAADTEAGLTLETRSRSILWVSDNGAENSFSPALVDAFDDAFVELLQNAGYAVHRFNPPNSQDTLLTVDQLAAINTNGLVIIGRAMGSGAFQAPQGAQWNTQVAVPLIAMSSYLVRETGSRMGWFTGNTLPDGTNTVLTAVNLEDPVTAYLFRTVSLDAANTTTEPYDTLVDRGTSHIVEAPVAGGTTRATALPGEQTVQAIATFPAGTLVRSGADILAGYRMFFAGGSREASGAVTNAGKMNLTETGQTIFLRAVELALNEGAVPDEPPSGPVLSIVRVDDTIEISWSGTGFHLEETSELDSGAWLPVAGGGTSPVTIPIGAGEKFFRLSDE